jgi:UDP-galactopyranose mutase
LPSEPQEANVQRILVVGAGFAGATYARELAERNYYVDVIDKRPHVAGNAYDEISDSGLRVHRYGPHLFHTNNANVVQWLTRFGVFVPYEHRVSVALADGAFVPLPINRQTINTVFNTKLCNAAEVQELLHRLAVPCKTPRNAAEYLESQIGVTLTDLFFRPYTRKMWALDLEDMDAAVVKRVPLRYDDEDRYFPDDRFQMLPRDGYTSVISAVLDHSNIRVTLRVGFEKPMLAQYFHCFNSMPIDEYFDFVCGPLPYRSIRFHHREEASGSAFGATSVVNFSDASIYTRQTDWSRLPAHTETQTGRKCVTVEEPCDYTENQMERYYPIKTHDGQHGTTYARYKALADAEANLTFIGRCGTYQYLDMHQVINQSLRGAHAWMDAA